MLFEKLLADLNSLVFRNEKEEQLVKETIEQVRKVLRLCNKWSMRTVEAEAFQNAQSHLDDSILSALRGRFNEVWFLDDFEIMLYGPSGQLRRSLFEKWTETIARGWRLYREPRELLILQAREEKIPIERAKKEAIHCSLFEALQSIETFQKVRLGGRYVGRLTLEGEIVKRIRPCDYLAPEQTWLWVQNKAIRIAEEHLSKERLIAAVSVTQVPPLESTGPDPLETLIAAEEARRGVQEGWSDVLANLTEGQQRVMEALLEASKTSSDWRETQKEAAELLSISSSTLRVHLYKIRNSA